MWCIYMIGVALQRISFVFGTYEFSFGSSVAQNGKSFNLKTAKTHRVFFL